MVGCYLLGGLVRKNKVAKNVCSRNAFSLKPWWTFRIFFIFFCSGSPIRRGGGGGSFFVESPKRGGGGVPGGEGPGGCLRRIGRFGGANFFCSGPKCPPRNPVL